MKKIFICVLFIIVISCAQKKQAADDKRNIVQTIEMEEVLNNPSSNSVSLTEFIDTIKYIPLETTLDCYMQGIQKIIWYKNNFYIYDFEGIFKFNSEGKFVGKIGKWGVGPQEYRQCRGIIIHSDTLFINGGTTGKVLAFDTNSGLFLASYPFPVRTFFGKIGENFATLNNDNGYLEFFDYNGKLQNSINYEKYDREVTNVGGFIMYPLHDIFSGTHESLKISTSLNDTIFELKNSLELTPCYILNLGEYKLPTNKRVEYAYETEIEKLSLKLIRPVPLETKDYLFIQFGKWGTRSNISHVGLSDKKADLIGLGIFDKKSNRLSIVKDDIENYPCFYPNFSDGENWVISYVSTTDAIEFLNQNKIKNVYKPFSSVAEKVKIEDNPVIIIAKLKD
jgi:hypothetical protein